MIAPEKWQLERRVIMQLALEYKLLTARFLADMFGWSIQRASNRLRRLYDNDWLRRRTGEKIILPWFKVYAPSDKLYAEFDTYPTLGIDPCLLEQLTDETLADMIS